MSAPPAPALPTEVWTSTVASPGGALFFVTFESRERVDGMLALIGPAERERGWSARTEPTRYVLASAFDAAVDAEVERRLALRGAAE